MKKIISNFVTILFSLIILSSCSDQGKLIYGKWFLEGKNNTIEFKEDGKLYAKEHGMENFEFVGNFEFNDEKKIIILKNCKKSPDNGSFKVLQLDDKQLKLEHEGRSLKLNRLNNY
jgi:hypothetical protein